MRGGFVVVVLGVRCGDADQAGCELRLPRQGVGSACVGVALTPLHASPVLEFLVGGETR